MADFKAKVKQIIDEGFLKEEIRPDVTTIKNGFFKREPKGEKKETFDIDISMKGLKGRIQSKEQMKEAKNTRNSNTITTSATSPQGKYRIRASTKTINREIEIKEIPTTTTAKAHQSAKQSLYRDILESLTPNKGEHAGYKSKVKRDIEAFSNTLKESAVTHHKTVNKEPLPSIPNVNEQTRNKEKQIALTSHQSFNLINHKINSLLNQTKGLMNPPNKGVFYSNAGNRGNRERMSLWTKVTSINLDNESQAEVTDFSKSFDVKLASNKDKKQILTKMKGMFMSRTRKQSEDNIRNKLLLDF